MLSAGAGAGASSGAAADPRAAVEAAVSAAPADPSDGDRLNLVINKYCLGLGNRQELVRHLPAGVDPHLPSLSLN